MSDNSLLLFLNGYKSTGKGVTHVSVGKFSAAYNIPDCSLDPDDGTEGNEIQQELINRLNYNIFEQGIECNLEEKYLETHRPIQVDIDLKWNKSKNIEGLGYSEDFLKTVVKCFNRLINQYVETRESNIVAYVLQRRGTYLHDTYIKSGFHIIYPLIATNKRLISKINTEAKKVLASEIKHLDNLNAIHNVIDNMPSTDTPWTMYGCTKPGIPPYLLSYVFDNEMNPIPFDHLSNIQLINLFSVRRSYKDHIFQQKTEMISCDVFGDGGTSQLQRDLRLTEKLLNIINLNKLIDDCRYEELGKCVKNINPKLITQWLKMGESRPGFNEFELTEIWNRWPSNLYGLATLTVLAKEDNLNAYNEIISEEALEMSKRVDIESNTSVAYVFYTLYRFVFRYFTEGKSEVVWYRFNGHLWKTSNMYEVMEHFSRLEDNTLIMTYYGFTHKLSAKMMSSSPEERSALGLQIQQYTRIAEKLTDQSYKAKLYKELLTIGFRDENFAKQLDTNAYLIGFNNGVHDLVTNRTRDGRPDDYVSMSVGYDYVEWALDDPIFDEIAKFIKDIMPDDEDRFFLIDLFTSYLEAYNKNEKFDNFLGKGRNGKDKLVELMAGVFGQYAVPMSTALLTQKGLDYGKPDPELISSIHCRWVYFSETDQRATPNTALIKLYTGGGQLTGRKMHSGEIRREKPHFHMLLLSNYFLDVDVEDQAIWSRIVLLHFRVFFTDNAKSHPDYDGGILVKEVDRSINLKFDRWKSAVMFMLLKNYEAKGFLHKPLVPPKKVKEYVTSIRNDKDTINAFMTKRIVQDNTAKMALTTLVRKYTTWFEAEFNGEKIPTPAKLKEIFQNRYGPPVRPYGYRFKEIESSPEAEDDIEE